MIGVGSPAHRAWRLIPGPVRRRVLDTGMALMAPVPAVSCRPGPVVVAGLLGTGSGLGQGARLCRHALDELGFDTRPVNLSPFFGQADFHADGAGAALHAGEGGALIVHLNAPELPMALWRMGRSRVHGRFVVGYWAWELPALPARWRVGLRHVHEIWVPSTFTAEAVRRTTRRPVRVVGHPVAEPEPDDADRAAFGLPADALVVLSMFDMRSAFTRKNPIAAVRAFRAAFGDDPDKLLLLKAMNAAEVPESRRLLIEAIQGAPNIRVLEDKLSPGATAALMRSADVVLSLHRSEGFGLVIAEAMRLGKPVVATAWSGNMDFMSEANALPVAYTLVPATAPGEIYDLPATSWAEPEVEHAAACLRRLAGEPDLRHRLGVSARHTAEAAFGFDRYRATLSERFLGTARLRPTASAGYRMEAP
jgi:glycosyltransferase involved in cell wall biosynthesis